MKIAFSVFMFMLFLVNAADGQQITGKVVDNTTGKPLPFANIYIIGSSIGTTTNEAGEFSLMENTKPPIEISVSYIGYKKQVIEVREFKNPILIKMKSLEYLINEVNIYARSDENITSRKMEVQNEQMRNFSGISRDAMRAVQLLPGVSSNNASSAEFNVRGGNSDENLILINGVEVVEPYHIKADPMKSLGIFNIDMVNKMDFRVGGFPAEYGNVLSSMLQIDYNNEVREKVGGNIDLSMIGANLILGVPLSKKSSFNIGLGKSFVQQLIELTGGEKDFNVNFFDIHASLQYEISPFHKINFNAIYSGDFFDKDTGTKKYSKQYVGTFDGEIDKLRESNSYKNTADDFYSNTLFSIRSLDVWSSKVKSDNIISFYRLYEDKNQQWKRDSYATYDDYPEAIYEQDELKVRKNDYDTQFITMKSSWSFFLEDYLNIKTGIEYNSISYSNNLNDFLSNRITTNTISYPDTISFYEDVDPIYNDSSSINTTTFAYGAFFQNQIMFSDDFAVSVGVRLDYFEMNDNFNVSPRIASTYILPWGSKLNAAWGIYYRRPNYNQFRLDYASKDNTQNFKSTQYSVGIEHSFTDKVSIKSEYFRKEYDDLIMVERTHEGYLYYGNKLNDREGFAEGFDFNLSADTRDIFIWMSYGFLVAKEKEKGTDNYYYRSADQRHTLALLLDYKLAYDWDFTIKFSYGSGFAFTPQKKVFSEEENRYVWEMGEIHSDHLPAYKRFDIRLSKRFYINENPLLVYLDVLNVTNSDNTFAFEYTYEYGYPSQKRVDLMGIAPSFGISYEF